MRIGRLVLRAYGRFTDDVLDFPRPTEGDMHIVFGPNEAGKSTTLDALTDFLFGFGHHAAYHFLHDTQALRVGASLETSSGRIHAMRRRGNKQTLFGFDPETMQEDTRRPLAGDAVASLLAGLDRQTYRMLFGLDLESLAEGGRALAAGQGELGQSLFQAAAGLSALKRVGEELDAAADALFTRTGKKPELNQALIDYGEHGRKVRDSSMRSTQWAAAELQLSNAAERHERLQAERRRLREELGRLQRIDRNLPHLARRRTVIAALQPLQDAPRLSSDAEQRRVEAQGRLQVARSAERHADEALQRLSAERASFEPDAALLAAGAAVERLDRQADAYVQARETLARNAGVLEAARRHLCELVVAISPETPAAAAASLLPPPTLSASVDALIERRQTLDMRLQTLQSQCEEKELQRRKVQARLADLPELRGYEAMSAAVEVLNDLPAIDSALQRVAAELEADRAQLRRRSAELGHADPQALASLCVPSRTELHSFRGEFERCERSRGELESKTASLQDRLYGCRQEMRRLEAGGEMVTVVQLGQAREHRNRLWKVVRRMFVDGDAAAREAASSHGTDKALPEAFERGVAEADRLADQLRADTERATRHADCSDRIRDVEKELASLGEIRTMLDRDYAELRQRWSAVCAPLRVPHATPELLLEWSSRREDVLTQMERLGTRDADLAGERARRDGLWRDLERVLDACGLPAAAPGESVALVMQRLRLHGNRMNEMRNARETALARTRELDAELEQLQLACVQASAQIVSWDVDWRDALGRLHLPPDTGREAVRARQEQFKRLAAAIKDLETAERVAAEQGGIVSAFEGALDELERLLGRSSGGLASELRVARLQEELGEARRLTELASRIRRDMALAQEERRQAVRDIDAAGGVLAAMANEANCEPDALADVQRRAAERARLESQLAEVELTLQEINGRDAGDVEAEAAACDIDGIANAVKELDERIVKLDDDEGAAREARAEAQRAFDALDGSAAAAELQQAQAELGARIQSLAQRWSRSRLAAVVLQRVVQQYRERHQGPLMERASSIFAHVTCGSFSGLTTDYVDDRQILLGIRPRGDRVPVEGMSKGTCDQLYLALRLATIESHVASRGPIPVVVDDLLVQFDDERAVATLRQLHELSKRTQVLFFTHHEHLLGLAEGAGIANAVSIHRLERAVAV